MRKKQSWNEIQPQTLHYISRTKNHILKQMNKQTNKPKITSSNNKQTNE